MKFWIQKFEGKTTTLIFWIQKFEGKSTTSNFWIQIIQIPWSSRIFFPVFSLIRFWILIRNVDWHHITYTSNGENKKKYEKCKGHIRYCLIVQHYQSYQKRFKVCSATLNYELPKLMNRPSLKTWKMLNIRPSTGCLNMICQTSNQHIFRMRWHFKQKLLLFGILTRGDLCMDNQFLGCLPYTASTASDLQGVKIQFFWS